MEKSTFFIAMLSAIFTHAQEADRPASRQVQVSVHAAYLSSWFSGADLGHLTTQHRSISGQGFAAGLLIDNPIGAQTGLMHELWYHNSSSAFPFESDTAAGSAVLKLNSLRLSPISGYYQLNNIRISAGPFVNMLLAAKVLATSAQGDPLPQPDIFGTQDDAQDDAQYLQKFDYGFALGGTYRFPFGASAGIHYWHGFASLFDNSNSFATDPTGNRRTLKIHQRQLAISVGYQF